MKLNRVALALTILACSASLSMALKPVPIAPSGRITNTRTPTFEWSYIGTNRYTVDIHWGINFRTVSINGYIAYTPDPGSIGTGRYWWRVKKGAPSEPGAWSEVLEFSIPPKQPVCKEPILSCSTSHKPVFRFYSDDDQIDRFDVQLFQADTLLGTITASNTYPELVSVRWPNPLPDGQYEWRVRGVHLTPGDPAPNLPGIWSPRYRFSVGVPVQPTLYYPYNNLLFSPGVQAMTIDWNPDMGTDAYMLRLGLNGTNIFTYRNLILPTFTFVRELTPGRYTLTMLPTNAAGNGPWSQPVHFEVHHNMQPSSSTPLPSSPTLFTWYGSPDATAYRFRLYALNNKDGRYQLAKDVMIPKNIASPQWVPESYLPDGAYRWEVTDFKDDTALYTSRAYFEVRVPSAPTLNYPLGKVRGHRDLEFFWQIYPASITDFQFQLREGDTVLHDSGWKPCTNFIKKATLRGYETVSFPTNATGPYTWRVRARSDIGPGPWTEGRFTLAPLAAPVLNWPRPGMQFPAGSMQLLQWLTVPGATRYEFEIWRGGVRVDHGILNDTGKAIMGKTWYPGVGPITIRIRAGDVGWGPWSSCEVIGLI